MAQKMTSRAALLIATEAIGKIDGCTGNYRFKVPVRVMELEGATRLVTAETWHLARRRRTEETVQLALGLMGIPGTIEFLGNETGSAREVLDLVLADADAYITTSE